MSRMILSGVAAIIVVMAGLQGQVLLASTVAVGPNTCQPTFAHFATIQSAVSAVPFGSTVLVCPGTYPEQVAITQPLTLKGVTDGVSGAAVITVPGSGLLVNANTLVFGPVTAQLLIQNTVGVTVSNITVDGTGSGCVPGANRESGIVLTNVGTPNDGVLAAKIQNVVVRNVHGCGLGEGIVTDSSYVTVSSNQLHDIDRTAIVSGGGKNSVASNSIQTVGLNGLALIGTNQTLATNNAISGASQAGIYIVSNTRTSTVLKNTVLSSPWAIGVWAIGVSNNSIISNKVGGAGWGVVLQFCAGNVVQSNTFNGMGADGIFDQNSFGGNVVNKNTVNEAAFGIFTDSTVGGDTLVPNGLFNTVVTVDPSPAALPNADF